MSGRRLRIAALAGLLVLLMLISLSAGRTFIPLAPLPSGDDPRALVIFELRLPRTLLAVVIGAALGLGGAALQGLTRNPLADPGVLGVSATASLGAVLALAFGLVGAGALGPNVGAVLGAAAGVGLLLLAAGLSGDGVVFLLSGVVLNTLAAAGVALALTLSPDPWAASEIQAWLMGSLADRGPDEVVVAAPLVILGAGAVLATAPALDALTLGDVGAASLGVSLRRTRLLLVAGIGLSCGAATAAAGAIGFVGLMTPHLLRPVFGERPGGLLAPSALGGGALLLAADILVRLIPSAVETPVSVALALLGAPFFAILLFLRRRRLP